MYCSLYRPLRSKMAAAQEVYNQTALDINCGSMNFISEGDFRKVYRYNNIVYKVEKVPKSNKREFNRYAALLGTDIAEKFYNEFGLYFGIPHTQYINEPVEIDKIKYPNYIIQDYIGGTQRKCSCYKCNNCIYINKLASFLERYGYLDSHSGNFIFTADCVWLIDMS